MFPSEVGYPWSRIDGGDDDDDDPLPFLGSSVLVFEEAPSVQEPYSGALRVAD